MNPVSERKTSYYYQNTIPEKNQEMEITKKVKRQGNILQAPEEELYITPKKRKITTCDKEGVLEFLRDDAYMLGLHQQQIHLNKLCKEKGIEIEAEETKEKPKVAHLKKADLAIIEEIREKKGFNISEQLLELYLSLPKSNSENRHLILTFALKIIAGAPDKVCGIEEETEEPLDEGHRQMAEQFLSRIGFEYTENQVLKLARNLQNEMNKEETSETDSIDETLEDLVIGKLGALLLVVQKEFKEACVAVSLENFDEGLDHLYKIQGQIIDNSIKTIEKHKQLHKDCSIQDHLEACFHKMSIEMADLLLLDTGGINFGLLDILAESLIPQEFQDLLAVNNLKVVMATLGSNAMLSEKIASIKAPTDETNPACFAIRTCLNIPAVQPITDRHARHFVLSAVLGHYRQAKVGTCFTTAFLIKNHLFNLDFFIQDLKDLTMNGKISRTLYGELRHFPYFNRVSREFLDTVVQVENDGFLLSIKRSDTSNRVGLFPSTLNQKFLYESPGISAACSALGFKDTKQIVLSCIEKLESTFEINDLLKLLAKEAFHLQNAARYHFRFSKFLSEEAFLEKAQYAFGVQTHHPLHRAYEQATAIMPAIFGSQYSLPIWTHETLCKLLDKTAKKLPSEMQKLYKKLKAESFLPLISRMRFRYNPNIDDEFKLFENNLYGADVGHFYGYELCDADLPADFEYSTTLYDDIQKEKPKITIERFEKYRPETEWKAINSEGKFQLFIQEVIRDTIDYMRANEKQNVQNLWIELKVQLSLAVQHEAFGKRMTEAILGNPNRSHQKKEWEKNPYSIQTTPWTFKWGGSFDEVMKTYFGFTKKPSKTMRFNGTPKEVLAKHINFIKNQSEDLKNQLCDQPNLIIMASPVHAFLMTPNEPTFVEAVKSNLSTYDYIKLKVELPGVEVACTRLNIRERKEIIEYIASNQWIDRESEKEDFVRQKLTEHSKQVFDQLIMNENDFLKGSMKDFVEGLAALVAEARISDPKIGCGNAIWEKECKNALNHLAKSLVGDMDVEENISEADAKMMINFARNREDTVALSEKAKKLFINKAGKIPYGLSVKDFREAVMKAAEEAHYSDTYNKDKKWTATLAENVDTKIFKCLSEEQREKLLNSAIITSDPNWKYSVYDVRLGFMVNPGTGKIEFFRTLPDLDVAYFFDQTCWFPDTSGKSSWKFPGNYRTYKSAPLFNVNKYMGV